jgi:peptidoglycan/xylan/chitin deacetylase (PgdA/CDA1 family)
MHVFSKNSRYWLATLLCFAALFARTQQTLHDADLEKLIRTHASESLKKVLDNPDEYQYQLIYTEIHRDAENKVRLSNRYLRVNDAQYFNPASMVKLPTALFALEKMEELHAFGVNPLTLLKTDTSAAESFYDLIRQAMIVSDNVAYNKLFQFVGQEALNTRLQEMGYTGSRITRRFIPLTPEQHRLTEPVKLLSSDGRLLVDIPARRSRFEFDFSEKILVGNAHYNWSDSLIHEPFDFTTHNRMPLRDLQQILQSLIFPKTVPLKQRFRISENSRRLMLDAISTLPFESQRPVFDTTEFFDSYTKFFLYRDGKRKIPSSIRIYNKTGWSYGFLIDAAYIVDQEKNREFMLTGVIYVNKDGILNDNKYEYDSVGYPFFREIGEIIAREVKPSAYPVGPAVYPPLQKADAAKSAPSSSGGAANRPGFWKSPGALTRGDTTQRKIAIVFTGHEFAEGGETIASVLKKRRAKASFFFTGDFYRNPRFASLIRKLHGAGHYLGAHGDKHRLYNDWTNRDSLLVSRAVFESEIRDNEKAMQALGIDIGKAVYFLPSYEWYNDSIVCWTNELGRHLVNLTPGTLSHADYTGIADKNYRSSPVIMESIKSKEARDGLNGFILLLHIGAGPGRPDPFWRNFDELVKWLQSRGYQLVTLPELFTRRAPDGYPTGKNY